MSDREPGDRLASNDLHPRLLSDGAPASCLHQKEGEDLHLGGGGCTHLDTPSDRYLGIGLSRSRVLHTGSGCTAADW